ncbi:MAG: hypothetical protein H0X07_08000 [Gemmatimonadales bacterium]|nr:hypothetical protein [Gemmatimonadales bacterium]
MPFGRPTFPFAVSVVALSLLLAVQAASWHQHRRWNAGAFLLLIFVIGPLFAGRQNGKT